MATKKKTETPKAIADLTEEEAYLFAILTDPSGIDLHEFAIYDNTDMGKDDCFRAWPFQYGWWRSMDPKQIDQGSRSLGKSKSIVARACVFPFVNPGEEMVITAPELIHLEPITGVIEGQFYSTRLLREMLPVGRSAVTHRPFQMNFVNGSRIIGRIPQRDGKGVKGIHPIWLEMDECFPAGSLIWTKEGVVPIEEVQVGDEVLTHEGRWRKVTATFDRGIRDAVVVGGQGHPGITCTPNHKFYTRSEKGWEWVPAKDLAGREWAVVSSSAEMAATSDAHSFISQPVHSVVEAPPQQMYDLEVEDDHSFVVEGIVVHNSQDYPALGWKELVETVKVGVTGAVWRAHGVTRGVQDEFYRFTTPSPSNDWTIHHYPAMWRPTWSDEERETKMRQYSNSRDDPDYRRNVLGLHGDATQPLFVAAQLMKSVDIDVASDYNLNEYFKLRVSKEELEQRNVDIDALLNFPRGHLSYAGATEAERRSAPKAVYWAGMDIGMTIDPSEILVFVEYPKEKGKGKSAAMSTEIKLLTRISMIRMPHEQQIRAILGVISHYRPKAFCMDKGGVGYPFFQEIQEHLTNVRAQDWERVPPWVRGYDLEDAVKVIKGYTFSDKIVVGIDESIELGPRDDPYEKAGIRRNAKEHATDTLREIVDRVQFKLPWDESFIKEFQGATQSAVRSMDQYGTRRFSSGNDHVLDASRFFALAWSQHAIEEFMASSKKREPVFDSFL